MRSTSPSFAMRDDELFSRAPVLDNIEKYVAHMVPLHDEIFVIKDLSLSVTAFNVGCKKPMPTPTALLETLNPITKKPADIIAVAFQEIDMSATALIREETEAAGPWIAACKAVLNVVDDPSTGGANSYFALPPRQLVGLLLCVYLRTSLFPFLRDYQLAVVATGAMGSVGNKGGVGVRLAIDRFSICFLTVHLPSGQNEVVKRNASAETILTTMDFNALRRSDYEQRRKTNSSAEGLELFPPIFVRDQDIVVVAGDLNYRVNLNYDESLQLTTLKKYRDLLQQDQLEAELQHPHTPWYGFTAVGPITHPPTYRFDVGTSTYDTSEKHRIPGYTDRILIFLKDKTLVEKIKMDSLQARMDVTVSDHKPLVASLRVPSRWEDPPKRKALEAQLKSHFQQASCSNDLYRTNTRISTNSLNFEDLCSYVDVSPQSIEIANTGKTVAFVRIVQVYDAEDRTLGSWLTVTPTSLVILPGCSKKVSISACINSASEMWLSEWKPFLGHPVKALQSKLKVVVRSSASHLVTCKANLLPSIVGSFLDSLYTLGNTPLTEAYQLRKSSSVSEFPGVVPQVPKELWIMGAILSQHPHQRGLFTTTVEQKVAAEVFRRLDSSPLSLLADEEVKKDSNVALLIGHCLVVFLQKLIIPVIPYERYSDALSVIGGKGSGNNGAFASSPLGMIESLPTLHANIFIYVLSLLLFLLRPENSCYNLLSVEIIGNVFGKVLLRRPRNKVTSGLPRGTIVPINAMLVPEEPNTKPLRQKERQQLEEEQQLAVNFVKYFLVTPSPVL